MSKSSTSADDAVRPPLGSAVKCIFTLDLNETLDILNLATPTPSSVRLAPRINYAAHSRAQGISLSTPRVEMWPSSPRPILMTPAAYGESSEPAADDIFKQLKRTIKRPIRPPEGYASDTVQSMQSARDGCSEDGKAAVRSSSEALEDRISAIKREIESKERELRAVLAGADMEGGCHAPTAEIATSSSCDGTSSSVVPLRLASDTAEDLARMRKNIIKRIKLRDKSIAAGSCFADQPKLVGDSRNESEVFECGAPGLPAVQRGGEEGGSVVSTRLAAMREAALLAMRNRKNKDAKFQAPAYPVVGCEADDKEEGEVSAEDDSALEIASSRAGAPGPQPTGLSNTMDASDRRTLDTGAKAADTFGAGPTVDRPGPSSEREEGELSDEEIEDFETKAKAERLAAMREAALLALKNSKNKKAKVPQPLPPHYPGLHESTFVDKTEMLHANKSSSNSDLVLIVQPTGLSNTMDASDRRTPDTGAKAADTFGAGPTVDRPGPSSEREEGELSDEEIEDFETKAEAERLAAMREAALLALKNSKNKKAKVPQAPPRRVGGEADDKEEGELSAEDDSGVSEWTKKPSSGLSALREAALKAIKARKPKVSMNVSREDGEVSEEEAGLIQFVKWTAADGPAAPAAAPKVISRALYEFSFRSGAGTVNYTNFQFTKVPPFLPRSQNTALPKTVKTAIGCHLKEYLKRLTSSTHTKLPPPAPLHVMKDAPYLQQPYLCSWCGVPRESLVQGNVFNARLCFSSLEHLLAHVQQVHTNGRIIDPLSDPIEFLFFKEYKHQNEYYNEKPSPLFTTLCHLRDRGVLTDVIQLLSDLEFSIHGHRRHELPEQRDHETQNAIAAEDFLSSFAASLTDTHSSANCRRSAQVDRVDIDGSTRRPAGDISTETEDSDDMSIARDDKHNSDTGSSDLDGETALSAMQDGNHTDVDVDYVMPPTEFELGDERKHASPSLKDIESEENTDVPSAVVAPIVGSKRSREEELNKLLEREADLKSALLAQKLQKEIKSMEQLLLYQGNKIADLRSVMGGLQQAEHEQAIIVDGMRKDREKLLQRAAKVDYLRVELMNELASTRLQMHLMQKSQGLIAEQEKKRTKR